MEEKLQQDVPLMVHVFNTAGQLLSSSPVDADNTARLPLAEKELLQSRIFISPSPDNLRRKQTIPTIQSLQLSRAYELPLRTITKLPPLATIPIAIGRFWQWRKCHVTGTITTPFAYQGVPQNLPVCDARVHICEVDFGFISFLPNFVIQNIQWQWWHMYKPTIKFPFTMPDKLLHPLPVLNPNPVTKPNLRLSEIDRKNEVIAGSRLVASGRPQQVFSSGQLANGIATGKIDVGTNFFAAVQAPVLTPLDKQTEMLMSSSTLTDVQKAIVLNPDWFKPLFCYWWPWLYTYFPTTQELAVVQTNKEGKFDADILYQVFGDKPDVYIWVEYLVDGTWTTIYKPSVPCSTRWNYVCGTPININIKDHRIRPCFPKGESLDGAFVDVMGIGPAGNIPTQTIQQVRPGNTGSQVMVEKHVVETIGLAKQKNGNDINYCPWGGTLELATKFGTSIVDEGFTHFRWSYVLMGESAGKAGSHTATADLSFAPLEEPTEKTEWTNIDGGSAIAYEVKVLINGSKENQTKLFPLKEKDSSNNFAFRIPPKDIADLITPVPGEPLVPSIEGTRYVASMFDTRGLLNGVYALKLELFKKIKDEFKQTDIAATSWKVPNDENSSITEDAPDAFLLNKKEKKAQGFTMVIRVDNNQPIALIDDVIVNGIAASNKCGFVEYKDMSDKAVIGFTASHPNDFASFDFSITKGNSDAKLGGVSVNGLTIAEAGNYDANIKGITVKTGQGSVVLQLQHYTSKSEQSSFTAATLLNGCTDAAFASILHVSSLAVNGSGFPPIPSTSTVAAFALKKV